MTNFNNIKKKNEYFIKIYDEILDLEFSKNMWLEFKEIVNHSKHFKKYGAAFLHWFSMNYLYRTIIQIAKLTDYNDSQKDDISIREYLKLKNETKDLQIISDIFNKIKKIRHKEIAHLTNKKILNHPTYKELNNDIDTLKKIIEKYVLLETKSGSMPLPVEIKELFSEAWIEKETAHAGNTQNNEQSHNKNE